MAELGRRVTTGLGLAGPSRQWSWWTRCWVAAGFLFLAGEMYARRGVVVGTVGLLGYGGIGLCLLSNRTDPRRWAQLHPVLDGMMLGPFVFLPVAYLTSWSLPICAAIGAVASCAGAVAAARRSRCRRPAPAD